MSTIKSSSEHLTLNADGSGNDVIIQSNGSTKAIVTAEGNVGIGITPDAWDSSIQAIQVGDYGSINEDTGSKTFDIRCNSYQSASADVHTNTDEATMFRQGGGKFHFYQAVSASADATASWTEPLRIDTCGDVQVKTGNLVIGTSGKGIDFSATSDAGGMTSEVLDDYEEGTWTPVASSGFASLTLSATTGSYTKIGNMVTIRLDTTLGGTGIGSGDIIIAGLPFTASATSEYRPAAAVFTRNLYADIPGAVGGFPNANTANLYLREGGTTGAGSDLGVHLDSGSELFVECAYQV